MQRRPLVRIKAYQSSLSFRALSGTSTSTPKWGLSGVVGQSCIFLLRLLRHLADKVCRCLLGGQFIMLAGVEAMDAGMWDCLFICNVRHLETDANLKFPSRKYIIIGSWSLQILGSLNHSPIYVYHLNRTSPSTEQHSWLLSWKTPKTQRIWFAFGGFSFALEKSTADMCPNVANTSIDFTIGSHHVTAPTVFYFAHWKYDTWRLPAPWLRTRI